MHDSLHRREMSDMETCRGCWIGDRTNWENIWTKAWWCFIMKHNWDWVYMEPLEFQCMLYWAVPVFLLLWCLPFISHFWSVAGLCFPLCFHAYMLLLVWSITQLRIGSCWNCLLLLTEQKVFWENEQFLLRYIKNVNDARYQALLIPTEGSGNWGPSAIHCDTQLYPGAGLQCQRIIIID